MNAGLAVLPAGFLMILAAPRSAKLVEARGSRQVFLIGYVFVLLGFLTMLLLWKEGISYLARGPGLRLRRSRHRPGGHARPRAR